MDIFSTCFGLATRWTDSLLILKTATSQSPEFQQYQRCLITRGALYRTPRSPFQAFTSSLAVQHESTVIAIGNV